ncbi:lamin tail domain-containing protein [Verrucomicrobiales bacterium]|nr:lamin tail domain-containing protein [Verrucomicrobiales bacterium]
MLCIVVGWQAHGMPVINEINEINYYPAPSDNGLPEPTDYEFVELYNPSDEEIDLSGFAFTRGIGFTFGEGAVLTPEG